MRHPSPCFTTQTIHNWLTTQTLFYPITSGSTGTTTAYSLCSLSDDIYDHTFSDRENSTYAKLALLNLESLRSYNLRRISSLDCQCGISSHLISSSDLGSIKDYIKRYLKQGGRMELLVVPGHATT